MWVHESEIKAAGIRTSGRGGKKSGKLHTCPDCMLLGKWAAPLNNAALFRSACASRMHALAQVCLQERASAARDDSARKIAILNAAPRAARVEVELARFGSSQMLAGSRNDECTVYASFSLLFNLVELTSGAEQVLDLLIYARSGSAHNG